MTKSSLPGTRRPGALPARGPDDVALDRDGGESPDDEGDEDE